jgi:hypothetical protein
MAQNAGHDIPLAEALTAYINDVLRHRRDEATVIGPPTEAITTALPSIAPDTSAVPVHDPDDEGDWRLNV